MKLFRNFSDEDFTHSWDSKPYVFKAHAEMYLEDWLAEFFAKHLVDREIQKDKAPDGKPKTVDDPSRIEYIAKALITAQAEPELAQFSEEIQVANKNKRGRPKKEEVKEEKEEEFEGLKN